MPKCPNSLANFKASSLRILPRVHELSPHKCSLLSANAAVCIDIVMCVHLRQGQRATIRPHNCKPPVPACVRACEEWPALFNANPTTVEFFRANPTSVQSRAYCSRLDSERRGQVKFELHTVLRIWIPIRTLAICVRTLTSSGRGYRGAVSSPGKARHSDREQTSSTPAVHVESATPSSVPRQSSLWFAALLHSWIVERGHNSGARHSKPPTLADKLQWNTNGTYIYRCNGTIVMHTLMQPKTIWVLIFIARSL